jgi:primosomal protein N' (replication factor Y)
LKILEIALATPLRRNFDYLPPADIDANTLQPGMRLTVSFGRQQLCGLLIAIKNHSEYPISKLKPALSLIDTTPLVTQSHFELLLWAANYYQAPFGDALFTALPTLLRQGASAQLSGEIHFRLSTQGKGLPEGALKRAKKQAQLLEALQSNAAINRTELSRLDISRATVKALLDKNLIEEFEQLPELLPATNTELLSEQPLCLNDEQNIALKNINTDQYSTYLLEGTTGSGKTEVYLQAIEKVLKAGKQALVLIPEIGLTPQTIGRFARRFNTPMAALHSGLSDKERLQSWLRAREGIARIIIGTRSAVFTPMKELGIIIIDEEHDLSFKQQEGFRYSARDFAAVRAQREKIPLLLGSATPALETLHNALEGRYQHLQLKQRAGNAKPPSLNAIDIRQQTLQNGFASDTLDAISDTLTRGNQALVFINRRGYAPTLLCHDCGWQALCPNCDARMTVHQRPFHLHCHHCDHQSSVPKHCPDCQSPHIQAMGQGTERSEDDLQQIFPNTQVLRIDRDTTRKKNAMADMLDIIHSGDPCILVGTQMLAKGHHFPDVTLVAIIDADGGMFSADFRGPERMGQLITQVAGRAGRASKPGRVIIQSHCVDHPLMETLLNYSYNHFAQMLLKERHIGHLPPYRYLAIIKAESKFANSANNFLQQARNWAEQLHPSGVRLNYLGPLPAIMERRNDRYRFQLHINAAQRGPLQQLLSQLAQQLEAHPDARKIRWAIDVDPQDMS